MFLVIKKPLLRWETKKLLDKASLTDVNDLLTQIIWGFTPNEYNSNEAFTKDIVDNEKYFTNVELLRKIHNQLAFKDLGGNEFLEGLEFVDIYGSTPVYRLMTGS